MFIHVKKARYIDNYTIELEFNDGKSGVVDLQDELYGSVFEPLREKALFAHFRVDEELETIVWGNGADLAPSFCTTNFST